MKDVCRTLIVLDVITDGDASGYSLEELGLGECEGWVSIEQSRALCYELSEAEYVNMCAERGLHPIDFMLAIKDESCLSGPVNLDAKLPEAEIEVRLTPEYRTRAWSNTWTTSKLIAATSWAYALADIKMRDDKKWRSRYGIAAISGRLARIAMKTLPILAGYKRKNPFEENK